MELSCTATNIDEAGTIASSTGYSHIMSLDNTTIGFEMFPKSFFLKETYSTSW
jgi:hypothetical protein